MLPRPGDEVCAGLDLGLRRDSSALVITHKRDGIIRVGEMMELRPEPGKPLKPSVVIATFAKRMIAHGCAYAVADAFYREAVTEHLEAFQLYYAEAPTQPAEAYVRTRQLMREGVVKIPDHPRFLQQLRDVQAVATSGGRLSIQNPRTVSGHSDLVSAFVLAAYQLASSGIVPHAPPEKGTNEWVAEAREKRQQKMRDRMEQAERMPWLGNRTPQHWSDWRRQ